MDDNEKANRVRAIQAQLEQLESLETIEHFTRWKARTKNVLKRVVSPDEANKFFCHYNGRTVLQGGEQLDEYKDEYRNYLIPLLDELANQPEAPAEPMWNFQGVACENGHKVAKRTFRNPSAGGDHCPICGAKTFDQCPACGRPLHAGELPPLAGGGRKTASSEDKTWVLASYCYHCGKPYPWTLVRSRAAEKLIDQLDELFEKERKELKASIPDLMADTPNSDAAALGWKKAFSKIGGPAKEAVMKLLTDIASAAVKDRLGL